MTVSCLKHIEITADKCKETNSKKRANNLKVMGWKSSPAGIDWQMIRSMREAARRKKSSLDNIVKLYGEV